jgi:hypothetical protein
MAFLTIRKVLLVAAALVSLATAGANAADWRRDWATLRNERHGFLIAYPVEIFAQKDAPVTDEGRVLYSPDGNARLMVGAFANEGGLSLREYRDFLMHEQYRGAEIEYAPVRKHWFVISGTIAGQEFYERVSFTCGGQLINSWAMVYPAHPSKQNRFYDRVVSAIARTYSPGAGATGNCD